MATIARTTTSELLAAVLPDQDPATGFAWLAARSFAEPLGRGLAIHDLLRRLLREQLRRKSPELELDLRRRIIDYLHDRGQREGLSVMLELVQLVENDPEGNAVLWQTAMALVDDPAGEVQSLLGSGGLLRSGLRNPRYIFLPINPRHAGAVAFAAAIGARPIAGLDVTVGALHLECHVADLGPGGALGAVRDVVYLEMGLPPPIPLSVPVDAVREAFRDLHDPVRLGSSSLASLIDPGPAASRAERAGRVSGWLRDATDMAFGESDDERVRRQIIEQTFWEPSGNHGATARELHLSRATYFRRLSEATERLSVWLSDHLGPAGSERS